MAVSEPRRLGMGRGLPLRALAFAALALYAGRAAAADEPPRIPVWPGTPPGGDAALVEQYTQMPWNERVVRNVARPTLQAYPAAAGTGNGSAVIIAPGGGFRFLSVDSEGIAVARWLSAHGVSAYVLRYRVMTTPAADEDFMDKLGELMAPLFNGAIAEEMKHYGPPAIADGLQALRVLRGQARQLKLRPDRIGFLGFSAGGVVATGVALQGAGPTRADFVGAIYPGPWDLSSMPKSAPPLFIAAAKDDPLTAAGAEPLGAAWQQAGRPVEVHLYEKGGHGFGMKQQDTDSDRWIDDFAGWLARQK